MFQSRKSAMIFLSVLGYRLIKMNSKSQDLIKQGSEFLKYLEQVSLVKAPEDLITKDFLMQLFAMLLKSSAQGIDR